MIIGMLIGLAGIGLFVITMINLAVFALPVFVGAEVGMQAFHSGAGLPGAIVVGFVAGVATVFVGQRAFASSRGTALRLAVAVLFTAPATVVGYNLLLGLSRLSSAHGAWQAVFASLGALAIGCAALKRLMAPVGDTPLLIGPPQPCAGLRANHGR